MKLIITLHNSFSIVDILIKKRTWITLTHRKYRMTFTIMYIIY